MEKNEKTDLIDDYLNDFATIADKWFAENSFIVERYNFFQEFKKRENLENADWSYFQKLGDNLNAFKTNPVARANALGRPNHEIEHYRKHFIELIYGEDQDSKRIDAFIQNIIYFSDSSTTELFGQIFPDKYVFYNSPDKKAIEVLNIIINHERKETIGEAFINYNNAIKPIIDKYESIVGKRTNTTLQLEVDQFFSYLSGKDKKK